MLELQLPCGHHVTHQAVPPLPLHAALLLPLLPHLPELRLHQPPALGLFAPLPLLLVSQVLAVPLLLQAELALPRKRDREIFYFDLSTSHHVGGTAEQL